MIGFKFNNTLYNQNDSVYLHYKIGNTETWINGYINIFYKKDCLFKEESIEIKYFDIETEKFVTKIIPLKYVTKIWKDNQVWLKEG